MSVECTGISTSKQQHCILIRVSQVSYELESVQLVWPNSFQLLQVVANCCHTAKVWILWIATVAVGVMMLIMYCEAWSGAKPTVYIVAITTCDPNDIAVEQRYSNDYHLEQ